MIAQAQTQTKRQNVLPVLPDIQMEAITNLRTMLKRYSADWASDLAMLMYPEEADTNTPPEVKIKNIRRVYNVCAGRVKTDEVRVRLLVSGRRLLEQYRDNRKEATEIAAALVTA